jgi:hypothetical protein
MKRILLPILLSLGVSTPLWAQIRPAPQNGTFVSITCGGNTGTANKVLIGGATCSWTGSPTLVSPIFTTSLAIGSGTVTAALPIFEEFTRNGQIQHQLHNASDGTSAYAELLIVSGTTNKTATYIGGESELNADPFGAGRGYLIFHSLSTGQPGGDFYACTSATPANCFFRWNTNGSTTSQTRLTLTATALTPASGTVYAVTTGAALSVANVGANSCGTTAATIAGANNVFVITVGAGSGTQCRVAFPIAAVTEYDCTANDNTTTVAVRTTPVDTTHTDLIGTFTAGDKITGICFPR